MIHIELYKNFSEYNKVNKSIYMVVEVEGILRQGTSISSPIIQFEFPKEYYENIFLVDDDDNFVTDNDDISIIMTGGYKHYPEFNYAYIREFNRYYFVSDVSVIRDRLWQVEMKVDVLMSFKDTLLNQTAFIDRNEFNYDITLVDDELTTKSDVEVEEIFSDNDPDIERFSYTNENYILVSNGSIPNTTYETFQVRNSYGNTPNHYMFGLSHYIGTNRFANNVTGDGLSVYCQATNWENAHLMFKSSQVIGAEYDQCGIIGFYVYPFKTYDELDDKLSLGARTGSGSGSFNNLYTGNDNSAYLIYAPYRQTHIARFTYNVDNPTFVDYSLNKYSIWLPFHRFININGVDLINRTVEVNYITNLRTGQATVYVTSVKQTEDEGTIYYDYRLVYSGTCTVGLSIPVTNTNGNERERSMIFTGITSALMSIATGNMLPVGVGVGKFMNELATPMTYETNNNEITDGAVKPLLSYLKVVKTKYNEPDNYAKYYGRPKKVTDLISNYTGFTKISNIHLEQFDTALSTELTQLEQLCLSGIILGD